MDLWKCFHISFSSFKCMFSKIHFHTQCRIVWSNLWRIWKEQKIRGRRDLLLLFPDCLCELGHWFPAPGLRFTALDFLILRPLCLEKNYASSSPASLVCRWQTTGLCALYIASQFFMIIVFPICYASLGQPNRYFIYSWLFKIIALEFAIFIYNKPNPLSYIPFNFMGK